MMEHGAVDQIRAGRSPGIEVKFCGRRDCLSDPGG
jgi:hypothetical protein